jgi:hypothetical protein
MASRPHITVWAATLLLAPLHAGCPETIDPTNEVPPPALSLVKSGQGTVDLEIAGAYALRAIQARLVYDPATVTPSKVEPGREAERLDRVFFSDPAKASGNLVVGVTDTRRVLLPARGTLFRFHLQPSTPGALVTLELQDPLGSIDGGERVNMERTMLEVTLP